MWLPLFLFAMAVLYFGVPVLGFTAVESQDWLFFLAIGVVGIALVFLPLAALIFTGTITFPRIWSRR